MVLSQLAHPIPILHLLDDSFEEDELLWVLLQEVQRTFFVVDISRATQIQALATTGRGLELSWPNNGSSEYLTRPR